MLWDCPECGCLAIAADLTACPVCKEEREMPKVTVGGGSSNAAESEPDAGKAAAAGPPPPASAPKAEHVEYARQAGVPEDEAAGKTKAQLVEQNKAAAGDAPAAEEKPAAKGASLREQLGG